MRTRGAPVEVVPLEFRGSIQPQVALAPNGHVHLAFGKGTAIYHAGSTDNGRTFSKPVLVAEVPKLALGMRRGPRIIASDGLVTISAISHSEGTLFTWTSKDGGATWSQATAINGVLRSAREGLHAMADDGVGSVVLVWLDLRSGGMELWSAASSDGGRSWRENTRVYQSPDGHICECCHPSVALGQEGRVTAMWRNWLAGARDMYIAQSTDGGKSWGEGQKLGKGTWPLKGCPMDGGGLALTVDDEPVAVWRREKIVYTSGVHGPEFLVADGAVQPVVFSEPSGWGLLWQAGKRILIKRAGSSTPVVLAEEGSFPAAAGRAGGRPVVVWEASVGDEKTIFADVLE